MMHGESIVKRGYVFSMRHARCFPAPFNPETLLFLSALKGRHNSFEPRVHVFPQLLIAIFLLVAERVDSLYFMTECSEL